MDALLPELLAELLGYLGVADRLAFTAACRAARALRCMKPLVWGPSRRRELGSAVLVHGRFLVSEDARGRAVLSAPGLERPGAAAEVALAGRFSHLTVDARQRCFMARTPGGALRWLDGAGWAEAGDGFDFLLSDFACGWFISGGLNYSKLKLCDASGRFRVLSGEPFFLDRLSQDSGLSPKEINRVNSTVDVGAVIAASAGETALFLAGSCPARRAAIGEAPAYACYCSFVRWAGGRDDRYETLACFPVRGVPHDCAWLPEAGTALVTTEEAFYAVRMDGIRELSAPGAGAPGGAFACEIRVGATKVALVNYWDGIGGSLAVYGRAGLALLYLLRFPGQFVKYPHMSESGDRLGANLRWDDEGRHVYSYCEWDL